MSGWAAGDSCRPTVSDGSGCTIGGVPSADSSEATEATETDSIGAGHAEIPSSAAGSAGRDSSLLVANTGVCLALALGAVRF